jgi:acyl-coenzyme A thioesterase PaaI-like protein
MARASDPDGPFPRPTTCFGCGAENPAGLALDVEYSLAEGWCRAPFTPREIHIGPPGLVHGGIVATALDEAMAWMATLLGADVGPAVTGSLQIRYRRPLRIIDAPFTVEARLVRSSGRRHKITSTIALADSTILAEGEGLFLTVPLADWLALGAE